MSVNSRGKATDNKWNQRIEPDEALAKRHGWLTIWIKGPNPWQTTAKANRRKSKGLKVKIDDMPVTLKVLHCTVLFKGRTSYNSETCAPMCIYIFQPIYIVLLSRRYCPLAKSWPQFRLLHELSWTEIEWRSVAFKAIHRHPDCTKGHRWRAMGWNERAKPATGNSQGKTNGWNPMQPKP